ncbi:uncharacterized protein LOC128262889 [Drosophila gunungcola]|uniref:Uncharacterized protein n=1 Tax=Drosophila gunungcola TaxID=103775 RepID=A0A9P9YSJ9_9MUSC|nr:uncharacterized protein LOC128262889 [Drosophila gunungcola]KAI8042120.1 hypothetical protein M5D96_003422 [Drosophila gunungcola]
MCFNELENRSLLPDCNIANRVFLFTILKFFQEQDRRPEDVDVELRDRYNVFRQVLPNYPLPEHGNSQQEHLAALAMDSNSFGDSSSESGLDNDSS